MRKLLDRLYDGSLFLAGVFLVAIAALMIGESIARKSGGYITGASELVGWFCAAAGFLALPATFKRGDMVRVGVLLEAMPPGARRVMLVANLVIAAVFTTYMIYAVGSYIRDGWRAQEVTQGMIEIAVWVPQSSFLVGVVLLMISVMDELVVHLLAPAESLHAERPVSIDNASTL
jgi:TRAP-type C4-dicarboxylate transport system permease small subunit